MVELIFLFLTLPLLAMIVLAISPTELSWKIALSTTLILFGLTLLFWYNFDSSLLTHQFLYGFPQLSSLFFSLTLLFGFDGLTICFLLLTTFIFPLCFYYGYYTIFFQIKKFLICCLAIEMCLLWAFSSLNLFLFYITFESLLIPMFLLIGIWGSRSRKIQAAYFLILYTLFFSFFMLYALILFYLWVGNYDFFVLHDFIHSGVLTIHPTKEKFLWFFFFLTFIAKFPVFPFHIWLPEAHAEAPTVGSVIPAALLLKLGGYGVVKFLLLGFTPATSFYFISFCLVLGLISLTYSSFLALRQVDLKKIVAYSSIAHMSLTLLGLMSSSTSGILGAIVLMLAHGFVSAALFFLVGMLYQRLGTRLLKYCGGFAVVCPYLTFFFFSFSCANLGFPGSLNFIGELLIFVGLVSGPFLYIAFLSSLSFVITLLYTIWIFNRTFFGTVSTYVFRPITDLYYFEVFILSSLLIPTCLFGFYPQSVLTLLEPVVSTVFIV